MSDTRPPPCGDWLLTFSGHKFYPLDPRPEAVCLQDIAHALAHICRWTGHVSYHYSVAQHAVQVALAVEQMAPDLALLALHHDDAEAYLGDIARPWKRNLFVPAVPTLTAEVESEEVAAAAGFPHGYRITELRSAQSVDDVEERVRAVILDALGVRVPAAEAWDVIRVADNRVLQAEAETLMPKHDEFPSFGIAPPACQLYQITPAQARDAFLMHHNRLASIARLA